MPVVTYTVNGNGQLLVNPHGANVPENTVVTVEAVPYENEELLHIDFLEDRDGALHYFYPSPFGHNIWKFRTETYNTIIAARFSENFDPPPEPPEPPQPTNNKWLIAVLSKSKRRL